MGTRTLWTSDDQPCEGVPFAVIGPNQNPTPGNYFFEGINSSANGCVTGIDSYTWRVLDATGTTELTAGVDYTLNSPTQTGTDLDITFSGSTNFVVELTITSQCGNHTTTQPIVFVSNPIMANTGSDGSSDATAIVLTTADSDDGSGNNIADDVAANYTFDFYHTSKLAGNLLFRITGVGGGAPVFTNYNAGILVANQPAIEAAFTGTLSTAGMVMNKTTIRDILVADGVITDGVAWIVEKKVQFLGIDSATIDFNINRFATVEDFATVAGGMVGSPASLSTYGIGGYFDIAGSKGYLNIGYWPYTRRANQATTGPNRFDGNVQTLIEDINNPTELRFVNAQHQNVENSDVFASWELENPNIPGFIAYGTFIFGFRTGDGSWHQRRIERSGGAPPPIYALSGGGTGIIRTHLAAGLFGDTAGGPLDTAYNAETFELVKYPTGTGGYTRTGTESPLNHSGDPETVTLNAGGTAFPYNYLNVNYIGEFSPDESADYYFKINDTLQPSGHPIVAIVPIRIKLV